MAASLRRDEWLRFLESERAGTRHTLSSFLALLVTALVAIVAAFLTLPPGFDPESRQFLGAFSVWGLLVILAVTYAWYQYLGTVRSISQHYYVPEVPPFTEDGTPFSIIPAVLSQRAILLSDYWELQARDAGTIVRLMFGRNTSLPSAVGASVWLLRISGWLLTLLSVIGIISFLSSGLGYALDGLPLWSFRAAALLAFLSIVSLILYKRQVEKAYSKIRTRENQMLSPTSDR